jgi:hypothetical protein
MIVSVVVVVIIMKVITIEIKCFSAIAIKKKENKNGLIYCLPMKYKKNFFLI